MDWKFIDPNEESNTPAEAPVEPSEPAAEIAPTEPQAEEAPVAPEGNEPAPAEQPEAPVEPQAPAAPEVRYPDDYEALKEKASAAGELESRYGKYKDNQFINGLLEYFDRTGDITPYLEAKTVDFDKLPDEQIMLRELKEKNPGLSEGSLQRLLAREQAQLKLSEDLGEYDDDERADIELARDIYRSKVSQLREQYKQKQAEFRAPEPAAQEPNEAEAKAAEFQLKVSEQINATDVARNLREGKPLSVQVSDRADENYSLNVSAQELQTVVDNSDSLWLSVMKKNEANEPLLKDGVPQFDTQKLAMLIAFAKDMDGYNKGLYNHARSLERQKAHQELKNTTRPGEGAGTPAQGGPTDIWSAIEQTPVRR